MLVQTIQISFSSYAADTIRIHTGETGREILFAPDMEISGNYSADFIVIKPDDTFVIAAATITEGKINVEIPEQAGAVAGAGHYILKIYDSGNVCIYSASGGFMVDDHLLTDSMIESVAEVYGYNFPDDFMTYDDLVFNPISTASATVSKIKYKGITYGIESEAGDISKTVTGNPIELTDAASAPMVKCVTQITGYQSGTGTPSPDNIRPIVAYTEGEIEVSDGDGNTTTHTTTYPSAIYRGSEDVVNGTAREEWIKKSTFNFTHAGTFGNNIRFEFTMVNGGDCICSHFEKNVNVVANPATMDHDAVFAWTGGKFFFLSTPNGTNLTTTTQANDYFANNNVEIAYKLATPTTSSVTPTNLPIKSLSGYTHIESSTGDMEIEYITEGYQPLVDLIQRGSEDDYSTQEKIVGKWIDGKMLYERTITIQNVYITSQDKQMYYGVIDLSQYISNPSNIFPDIDKSYMVMPDTTVRRLVWIDYQGGTSVFVYSLSSRSNVTLVLTLQYTKTA